MNTLNTTDDIRAAMSERVMASEKKIIMVRTLLVRVKQHEAGLRLSNHRIRTISELIVRSPAEEKHIAPTLSFWKRNAKYHQDAINLCTDLDRELRSTMPAEDIHVAINEN